MGDDGVLTAEEVAGIDLRGAELVILSACETGLGDLAGGEGVFGLQRAFALAGARTVIASLWKVDDPATRMLMARFYQNLWKAERRMSKLEALREAQLWMLREVPKQPSLRRELALPFDGQAPGKDGRLGPFYWAAFLLSGDWR